jgi:hypothetical protein
VRGKCQKSSGEVTHIDPDAFSLTLTLSRKGRGDQSGDPTPQRS